MDFIGVSMKGGRGKQKDTYTGGSTYYPSRLNNCVTQPP